MTYFHVYIIKIENGVKRYFLPFNLSEKEVIENVAKPFMENAPFIIAGRTYYPSKIDKITIFKSTQKYQNLVLPNGKSPIRQNKRIVARLFLRKDVPDVSICTDQFIKSPPKTNKTFTMREETANERKVFIVHGKDRTAVKELRSMLIEFGLTPIILREQAGGSRTIVEKLEKYSNVGYAFVILTPDDFGGSLDDLVGILSYPGGLDMEDVFDMELSEKRARQNVILEFGYFMGLLGRDRVCCLYKSGVRLPSDMQGICYVNFDDSVNEAKEMITKELKAAGYTAKA